MNAFPNCFKIMSDEQKRLQTEIEEWKAALDDVGQKVTRPQVIATYSP